MKWIRSCAAAFRFLTIFPVPASRGGNSDDLQGAPAFFPVVGLTLGLLAGCGAWLLWHFLPSLLAATFLTFFLMAFSGALHLDGLADTADGFFSARERKRVLEIMRDSRTGVMGVVALFMVLMLKVSSLAALDSDEVMKTAFLMPLAGRCSLVVMMVLLPYVRLEGGLGTLFYSGRKAGAAVFSIILLCLASFVLKGAAGLVAAGLTVFILLLFCGYCYRKIGGATGDTMGAACELSEMSFAMFSAVSYWQFTAR